MFEYNYNPKTYILDVTLPKILHYNFEFMNQITELIKVVIDDEREYSKVRISCQKEPEYDKMCKAYIFNVLRYLTKLVTVLWSKELNNIILSTVNTRTGSKFSEIDIQKMVFTEELDDYKFTNDQNVNKPVEEIARIVVEKNCTIGGKELKEFLTTTIGEIFSNAFLHSEKQELFFIYDIESVGEDYFLCVTVIDYGNTIVNNVKNFHKKEYNKDIDSESCIQRAIVKGNTTRIGSGGYGLAMLIDYIENVKGDLLIFSGDVYYMLNSEGSVIKKAAGNFLGTSVTFRVKLFEMDKIIFFDKKNEELISISLENL